MNIEPAIYWMQEREAIRLTKERGNVPPWTKDPILAIYSFCNVRREDDRVTRWIDQHIRKPYADHPYLWFMLCTARIYNWPETLDELIKTAWPDQIGFCSEKLGAAVDVRSHRGDKVFTGAYMIKGQTHHRDWSKARYVAEFVLGALWAERASFPKVASLEKVHGWLSKHDGWGPFLSYQAVVDMRFTSILENAPDCASWAAAGPGTIRGLNRIHERPIIAPLSQEQALVELLELNTVLRQRTEIAFDFSDVPNICCEVDKYLRVKNEEGRPKTLYHYKEKQ